MIALTVKIDMRDMEKRLDKLSGDLQNLAVARALNKTAQKAKTYAARDIRDEGYNIRVGDIKKAIVIMKARSGRLEAVLTISGKPIPLIAYKARKTREGVSVEVKNGRKVVRGTFIAAMRSGHRGVFKRLSGTVIGERGRPILNRKIRELFGPSIPIAVSNHAVKERFEAEIRRQFPKLLDHEIKFILSKG